MPVTLQVAYPADNGSTFDMDYYLSTHIPLVGKHMGAHIANTIVTKGLAGGPDTPPPFHAVATIVFADQDAMNAAMKASGPVVADIPNFYDAAPKMLIGEVVG